VNLLGFGTNSIGYSGVIGCVELCDKDDENNALDCVGAVFSSLNIDVNDLSSSNQINIAFLSLFLQLLETGIRPSGYCGVFPCCVRNTTERAYFVQTWIRILFTRILITAWQAGPADTKIRPPRVSHLIITSSFLIASWQLANEGCICFKIRDFNYETVSSWHLAHQD